MQSFQLAARTGELFRAILRRRRLLLLLGLAQAIVGARLTLEHVADQVLAAGNGGPQSLCAGSIRSIMSADRERPRLWFSCRLPYGATGCVAGGASTCTFTCAEPGGQIALVIVLQGLDDTPHAASSGWPVAAAAEQLIRARTRWPLVFWRQICSQ